MVNCRPEGASGRLVGRAVTVIGNPALLIAYHDPAACEPAVWRLFINAPGGHFVRIETGHDNIAIDNDVVATGGIGTNTIENIIGSTVTVYIEGVTTGQVVEAILVRTQQ